MYVYTVPLHFHSHESNRYILIFTLTKSFCIFSRNRLNSHHGQRGGPATLICLYWIPLISSDQFSHMPYYCHALPGLPKQLYTRLTLSIASSYSHYHLCSSRFINVICTSFFSFTMVFHTTCLTAKAALPASAAFAHPSLSLMLEPNSLIQTLTKHC